MASVVIALVPAALLVGAYRLAAYLAGREPAGADGVFALLLLTIAAELAALALAAAGLLRGRRERSFALLGAGGKRDDSILVVLRVRVGPDHVASVIAASLDTRPRVVSPAPE